MTAISSLQNFVTNALDCTQFRMIRDDSDFEDDSIAFHPEMAHQIFGEQESIFGYRDLQIDVCFAAGPLDIYFNIKYGQKVEEFYQDGIKSDDVEKSLASLVEDGCYYTNLEEYKKVLKSKAGSFKPFGTKIDEFELSAGTSESTGKRSFEVWMSDCNDKEFLKYHARLESFSFWFIDAFSRVEHDPLWLFFIVYEKYSNNNNETRYATAGYFTVYQYYSYPEFIRPRISQILVLPPFQKLGIASRLIEHTVHNYFVPMKNVADITYEEPTDIVQNIRCVVDAKRCMTLPAFADDKLSSGFSKAMLQEAKEKFKINPKQCRVVYEILRLRVTDTKNAAAYRAYRVEVKKRLNLNDSKHRRDLVRLQKRGVDVSGAYKILPSLEDRIEQLNAAYKEVEQVYYQVIKKIKLSQ
ncbi:histone acetyltransferase type B catalytic subunit-like [Uranotaenia lowii]|uniref:histone acetyltransferase type B catalytic subunit-like n=1 Tax=Uranotaenia lowii TaxID=190385 RepID=UPI0024795D77|nr:histone acetyltransferase type B catalytic subunit-like [Uranotaenia lowii]XP_055607696.1 histone acetyltransferase type B catalytic subunit-like [Uranotaenia lowii]